MSGREDVILTVFFWGIMESDTSGSWHTLIESTLARLADSPLIRTAAVYIPGENYRTYLEKTVMMNLMYINWIFKYGNNGLYVLQIFQWLLW